MDHYEKECLTYFQSDKIWDRILKAFRKKYSSYASFAGTIKITGLSVQDIETLEGFFAKIIMGKRVYQYPPRPLLKHYQQASLTMLQQNVCWSCILVVR